jgi:hypothetical protein
MERKTIFVMLGIVATLAALASTSFSTAAFAQGNPTPGPHQKDTRCSGPNGQGGGNGFRGTGNEHFFADGTFDQSGNPHDNGFVGNPHDRCVGS